MCVDTYVCVCGLLFINKISPNNRILFAKIYWHRLFLRDNKFPEISINFPFIELGWVKLIEWPRTGNEVRVFEKDVRKFYWEWDFLPSELHISIIGNFKNVDLLQSKFLFCKRNTTTLSYGVNIPVLWSLHAPQLQICPHYPPSNDQYTVVTTHISCI